MLPYTKPVEVAISPSTYRHLTGKKRSRITVNSWYTPAGMQVPDDSSVVQLLLDTSGSQQSLGGVTSDGKMSNMTMQLQVIGVCEAPQFEF